MSELVDFKLNKATEAEIINHFLLCDTDFVPQLSERVEISSYANKIVDRGIRFEAWVDGVLVGLVSAYCNDNEYLAAYITSVSVLKAWQGRGIASKLMQQCIERVNLLGFINIELEVNIANVSAIRLYEKMNFMINKMNDRTMIMQLNARGDA